MDLRINPGKPLRGKIALKGDKSISHRAALFAALAEGESRFKNFLKAGVTEAMLNALNDLGVGWELTNGELTVQGKGFEGLREAQKQIDCGNSGTTMRLLAGALVGANLTAVLDGSGGLRQRPMRRVVEPLQAMGGSIEASNGGAAPLRLRARVDNHALQGGEVTLSIASAQVKSAVLLAGLAADGPVTVLEPSQSRDHTERMLAAMGASIEQRQMEEINRVTLNPMNGQKLDPLQAVIPGDFSSASFLIVAALITPDSEILIRDVGLNPTRTGLLEVLLRMGADMEIRNHDLETFEPVGDVRVRTSALKGIRISGDEVVRMIDEFPVLAAAAAYAQGETEIVQAEELRFKESDRIAGICSVWEALGIEIEERRDGFLIRGGTRPRGGVVDPLGDHRLAMASGICGLNAMDQTVVKQSGVFRESYPEFVQDLKLLGAEISDGS
jgi:3-phosphoshikimate 1-carboxyvinyltransferase